MWAGLLLVLIAFAVAVVRGDACSPAARTSENAATPAQGWSTIWAASEQAIAPRPVDPATRRASTSAGNDWDRLGPDRREALAAEAVAAAVADPELRAWAERRLSATRADYFRTREGAARYLELEQGLARSPW